MSDDHLRDPRGYRVVLLQEPLRHSFAEHFEFLGKSRKGVWARIQDTLTDPLMILEDPPQEDPNAPVRKGQEIFVSRLFPEWKRHIAVPVRAYDKESFSWPPAPTIEPPVRVALTAYDIGSLEELPQAPVIWRAKL